MYCENCGNGIPYAAHTCPSCGQSHTGKEIIDISPKSQRNTARQKKQKSRKSQLTTFLLCFFFGVLGVHRFYVGKAGTGLLMLLTGGGFVIWAVIDLIVIACGAFKDDEGNRIH